MPRKKSNDSGNDFDEPETGQGNENDQIEDEEDEEAATDPVAPPESEDAVEALDESAVQDEHAISDADNDVLSAKAAIEQSLMGQVSSEAAGGASSFNLAGSDMIQGVGIGTPEFDVDQMADDGPGAMVLNVYTAEKIGMEETRRCLHDDFGARAVADDSMPVNVLPSGIIDSQPHRHKARPSPCGISCGHFRVTAGTQGALARGRRSPRDRRLLLLSNNHVIANSNNARFGDNILQPGRADGGVNPRDRIAILERFVPINFGGGANFVDAATGWCWPRLVRKEFLFRSGTQWRFFRVSSAPVACRRGMIVGKSGRTTQLTSGRVVGCSETIRVRYGAGRVALFRDQISIRGNRGRFSDGGDSGSLVWTWDTRRNPVGLLFAGGGDFTFANKIGRVLAALDIRLHT